MDVALDEGWCAAAVRPLPRGLGADSEPPAYRGLYEESLAAAGRDVVRDAAIPVERIGGRVVLVAGGDDQVWPAVDFGNAIAARREQHGLATEIVTDPHAGHRTLLPGEAVVDAGQSMQRGGTVQADRALGDLAWPSVVLALDLRPERSEVQRQPE